MGQLNRNKLLLKSLNYRKSKIGLSSIVDPESKPLTISNEKKFQLEQIVNSLTLSRKNNSPIIFAFGAHLIRNGMSKVLIELMRAGYIQHLLGNGAVSIHDWELAYQGETTEDVKKYIEYGQFGLWKETGMYLNKAIISGARNNLGYGEAVGKMIYEERIGKERVHHRFKDISVLAEAYRLKIPFSICVGIGLDIIHMSPFCNGAAIGKTSYKDFLMFARTLENFNNGTLISIGSAITAPMVFEKALSMAKNIAIQNRKPLNYNIFVNDIQPSNWDWSREEPPQDNPDYYLRFLKTFSRTSKKFSYIELDNRAFLHNLYKLLKKKSC